jgi:energy-coupling factor transporter ATP-binding protein EcfA2
MNPHPMLFFNPDGQTFTFFGFYVDPATGTLINPDTRQRVFEKITISKELIQGIELQDRSLLRENISQVSKIQKISKILHVMGKKWATDGSTPLRDPDSSYELTMDNVLKMMGIYMRFRCNIPVIIMGETGCGKTRLIKYLCDLQKHPDQKQVENSNTIDFLSFLTNDTSYNENGIEYYKNQLIELDLSNNKIELIKIENLMYFENLKILNLSRNHIRVIDLKLISLIAPHLQVFDVSFNYIQKFSLLNVNNRGGMQTSATSYFYSIQLIYNYFLKDLIYINLSGNYISNILDLFSVTSNQLESSQEYCN